MDKSAPMQFLDTRRHIQNEFGDGCVVRPQVDRLEQFLRDVETPVTLPRAMQTIRAECMADK